MQGIVPYNELFYQLESVTERYALSDGARTLEMHLVQGLRHAGHMLMAYLPNEKILVEADLYSPPAQGAQPPATPNPDSVALYDNIKRLKLDVAQIVPIHGRAGSMDEFLKVIGKTN